MKRVTLDTNCFIDAFNPNSHAYIPMQKILEAYRSKSIIISISRHTLSELKEPIEAVNFAKTCEILPHFPIGGWDEQVACWSEVAGTWDDARKNQAIQEELEKVAKAGNDIRDRGAYIDALRAGMDVFVTSDTKFVKSEPAQRIQSRFGLRVVTPLQLVNEL